MAVSSDNPLLRARSAISSLVVSAARPSIRSPSAGSRSCAIAEGTVSVRSVLAACAAPIEGGSVHRSPEDSQVTHVQTGPESHAERTVGQRAERPRVTQKVEPRRDGVRRRVECRDVLVGDHHADDSCVRRDDFVVSRFPEVEHTLDQWQLRRFGERNEPRDVGEQHRDVLNDPRLMAKRRLVDPHRLGNPLEREGPEVLARDLVPVQVLVHGLGEVDLARRSQPLDTGHHVHGRPEDVAPLDQHVPSGHGDPHLDQLLTVSATGECQLALERDARDQRVRAALESDEV